MELVKGTTYLVVRKNSDYRPNIEEFKLIDVSQFCYKFSVPSEPVYSDKPYNEYHRWILKDNFENLFNIIEII